MEEIGITVEMMKKINVHEREPEIYDYIFEQIDITMAQVENEEFDRAENTYRNMVQNVATLLND